MKKNRIYTSIVLVIIACALVIQAEPADAAVETLRDITPEKPLIFMQLTGVSSIINIDANFWKQVAAAPFWELVYAQIESSSKLKEMHLAVEPGISLLSSIFGEDMVFVFPQFQQPMEISPLFMLKLRDDDETLKSIITSGIKIAMANAAKSTSEYGGYTIATIPLKGDAPFGISCALMDDVFAIGLGDLTLMRVIDLMNDSGDGKAVTKDKEFSSVMERMPLPDDSRMDEHLSVFYLDLAKLSTFGKGVYSGVEGNIPEQARPLAAKLIELMDLVASVSSAMSITYEGLISQGYIKLNPEATAENMLSMLQAEPDRLRSIEFVPEDVLGYSAGNLIDMKIIWAMVYDTLKKLPQMGDKVLGQLEGIQSQLGFSLQEDLISWMGNEMAYVYNEYPNFSKKYIPQEMCLIIKAIDANKASEGLGKITGVIAMMSQGKLSAQKQEYSGETIFQIDGLPDPIKPAYAVVDGYVLISLSTSYIQKLIDCKAGRIGNLEESRLYRSVEDRLPARVNCIQYMDLQRYFQAIMDASLHTEGMPSWEGKDLNLQKTVALQVSELAKLLSGAFGASVSYTVNDGSGLKTVGFMQVDDLESVRPISDPDAARIARGLAVADTYRKGNMPQKALSRYMEVLELDQGNQQANMGAADMLNRQGKADQASKYMARTGFVPEDAWYIVGPFDNPSGEGTDMVFPPEAGIQLDAEYEGKETVKWEKRSDGMLDGFVDLLKILEPDQWAVAYAWTKVLSKDEQKVELRVGSDDQVVVWLNGEEVLRHKEPRQAQVDQDVIPITLKKGENQLLLKVVNEQVDWGFYVRFTDEAGNPLQDLEYGK